MIVNTAKAKPAKISVPSFDSYAKQIITAQKAFDKVAVKAGEQISRAMQMHLDTCAAQSVPRDLAGVTALGKAIRECQVFIDAIAIGTFEKKTITEYAQSAMRAYFHNVPYAASLKNDAAYKIPGKDGATKSGSVRTTDNEAAFKTARKLLEQLRMLKRDDCASDVLDAMLEGFDGFSEHEAATI